VGRTYESQTGHLPSHLSQSRPMEMPDCLRHITRSGWWRDILGRGQSKAEHNQEPALRTGERERQNVCGCCKIIREVLVQDLQKSWNVGIEMPRKWKPVICHGSSLVTRDSSRRSWSVRSLSLFDGQSGEQLSCSSQHASVAQPFSDGQEILLPPCYY
jgi:hypothetical protein